MSFIPPSGQRSPLWILAQRPISARQLVWRFLGSYTISAAFLEAEPSGQIQKAYFGRLAETAYVSRRFTALSLCAACLYHSWGSSRAFSDYIIRLSASHSDRSEIQWHADCGYHGIVEHKWEFILDLVSD